MKLDDLRKQIDEVNWQILKLLKKRFDIAKKIANAKNEIGFPIEDKRRESEMLSNLIRQGEDLKLSSTFISRLFKFIINESKRIQKNNI